MAKLLFLVVISLMTISCNAPINTPLQTTVPPATEAPPARPTAEEISEPATETPLDKKLVGMTGLEHFTNDPIGTEIPTAILKEPRVRLDGPIEIFSHSNTNRTIPEDVLPLISFFAAGGGGGLDCSQYKGPTAVSSWDRSVWLAPIFISLCNWNLNESALVQVISPNGEVIKEETMIAFSSEPFVGMSDDIMYFRYTPELNTPPGIYIVRFSGASGVTEHQIEIVAPEGPRVYVHEDRIILFQFQPHETIRLLLYEKSTAPDDYDMHRFKSWVSFATDAEGQLIIEGFYDSYGSMFLVVGEKSGEVKHTTPFIRPYKSPFSVSVFRPTDEEVSQVPDIWSLVPFVDLDKPAERTYEVTVEETELLYWRIRWCAEDVDTLQDNLINIFMYFKIDGVNVDGSQIRISEEIDPQTGWVCRRWAAIGTNWPTEQPTLLEIEYELSEAVDDGAQIYPPGIYRQIVRVQATGNTEETSPPSSVQTDSQGQIYKPPLPENASFEPVNLETALDNVKSTIQALPASTDVIAGLETQPGPWIAPSSPDSLEPTPFQGPELWVFLHADTCNWPQPGTYSVSIEKPDGTIELDRLFSVDSQVGCKRYLEYLAPPVMLGTYILQFGTYENMRQSIDVVPPSGPRLYVDHLGNQGSTFLWLHQFAPHENIRLYAYKPDEQASNTLNLVGWQAFQTDANGQLYIGTPYCVSNICMSAPAAYYPTFVVIGDISGEVYEFDQFQEGPVVGESILVSPKD